MELSEYFNILKRYKITIICSLCISLLVGVLVCFCIPKVYKADGKLLLTDNNEMSNIVSNSRLEDLMISTLGKSDPLYTQLEIIKTRPIIENVINKLELKVKDSTISTEDLLKKIRVNVIKNTNLISIECYWRVPDTATLIVNTLMQIYVQKNQELNQEVINNIKDFIEKQLFKQKQKVEETEKKLVEFKNSSNIVSLDKETNVTIDLYNNLYTEYIRLKAEKDALTEQQMFYKSKIMSTGSKNDPLYAIWVTSLEQIDSQLKGIEAKEGILRKQLSEQKNVLKDVPAIEIKLMELVREQKVSTEIYTTLLSRYEEYKIQEASKIGSARIIEEGKALTDPVIPNKKLIVICFLLLGLVFDIVIYFYFEYYKRLPKLVDRIKDIFNEHCVGVVPYDRKVKKIPLFMRLKDDSVLSESIRVIQTNINYKIREDETSKVLMVTSRHAGEGKTLLSINLAYSLSLCGKVLLMEFDFRRPKFELLFGNMIDKDKSNAMYQNGLLKVINNDSIDKYVSKVDNLDIISAAPIYYPLNLIQSKNMSKFLDYLKSKYNSIIIDAPPMIVAETIELFKKIDEALIVIDSSDKLYYKQIQDLKGYLDKLNISYSLIINKAYIENKDSYYYNNYYGYTKS